MSNKKILSVILSAAIAFGMCIYSTKTVRAEGTEQDPKVIITKVLRMDQHVTMPDVEFTFIVDKVSLDQDTSKTDRMPAIQPQTIRFESNEEGIIDNLTGIKTIRKQTGNGQESFLPKCGSGGFQQVGIYTYKITEQKNTINDINEIIKYSQAEYEMTVFVIRKPDGTGIYISNVIVQRTVDNGGIDITDVKINNPGVDTADTPNDLIFVNDFTRIGGSISVDPDPETPENPDSGIIDNEPNREKDRGALKIYKTVSGDMGDKRKDFTFTLTLTKASALEPPTASYIGTIKRAYGSASPETLRFTIGKEQTFTLKHNEYLFFTNLPVGTTFTVTENPDKYESTQATISNGMSLKPANQENVLIGEGYNIVGFNNELEGSVLTGIIVNNLPFVLLIVIAVSGFAAVLISKRRR